LLEDFMLGGVYAGLGKKPAQVDIFDLEPQVIFRAHDTPRISTRRSICGAARKNQPMPPRNFYSN
jgi:hypothetical protein